MYTDHLERHFSFLPISQAQSADMDSIRTPTRSELHSPRLRLTGNRSLDAENRFTPSWPLKDFIAKDTISIPWLGWLFVFALVQFYFSISRCLALKALVTMYGSPEDYTTAVKLSALTLGFLEDFICTTYFATMLWIFDTFKKYVMRSMSVTSNVATIAAQIATFTVSWLLFLAMMAPFVADMMLVVYRDMRFSYGLLFTLIRERNHLKDAPISSDEVQTVYVTAVYLVVIAALFATVRTKASWANLAHWNPTHIIPSVDSFSAVQAMDKAYMKKSARGMKYEVVALEDDTKDEEKRMSFYGNPRRCNFNRSQVSRVAIVVVGLVVLPKLVIAVRCACTALVAYAALNVTLNELLFHAFEPAPLATELTNLVPWVKFIDPSEEYQLFGDYTLYRRTTGFRGDLAFNVSIDNDNPPNVLLIGVESFRYRDSRYLVGEEDPNNLFKGTDLTITPNFDRWAKRGVALRNIWSSIPTSRSLESILFAQVPYHSSVQSGITGGRNGTNLSGLPQLFSRKGYETYFTTGSSIDLDNWDVFLPSHGYDFVWEGWKMKRLAEEIFNISQSDWDGDEHRGMNWGVHDDLSFQILGDLLVEKKSEKMEKMAQGEPNKPLFLTHYTISSHEPYDSWPKWYEESEKPDLSAMYEGEEHADRIEKYLRVRSFSDLELGKFMDRMEKEGVLNDTIVVIIGDHGQAPEIDNCHMHEESVTRVPAAIIAEGRLGDAVGLMIDDAAEQYDILNTLADITGLPDGGFPQNGVGRSLKRNIPFGERVIFSNDPMRKMAVVRGHERLRYDAVMETMTLHDTEHDYYMTADLLPLLNPEERTKWEKFREDGRRIAEYYTKRWDSNCLLVAKC